MREFVKASVGTVALASVSLVGLVWSQLGPESALRGITRFQKRVVVSGLGNPWEITWGPDGKLWVTERTAKRVTRIDPASGERSVAVEIDEVSAPGGQEGLLGMALHPELLKGSGKDFVYLAYNYIDEKLGADPNVADPKSPYRYFYLKIVRYTYSASDGKLSSPREVLAGLPAGNDHVGGRLKFGPDSKLYVTLGDQGHGQGGNFCLPIESQRIPTAQQVQVKDYSAYVGKTLRLNLDGSIPSDNPILDGVLSHVFTIGHRNTQGIDFAPDGTMYGAEHGPKSDDEVNVLTKGSNYGWPNVAGFKDDKAYEYAPWYAASNPPCSQLRFSEYAIAPSVPKAAESAYTKPFVEPLATLFTVPTGHNFVDPKCNGIDYICWPTVAVSSVEHYQSGGSAGIPEWDRVLLVTTLKRGSLYVVPLDSTGKKAAGRISRYFQSENRYRDVAVSPDRRTIFVATDSSGLAESASGGVTRRMQDAGAILAFTYTGEGTGAEPEHSAVVSKATPPPAVDEVKSASIVGGVPPQFTRRQSAAGKTAYNSNCATCHGSNLTNATMGTPLAGDYFRKTWTGKSVRELYDRAHKTMPPGTPGSLPADTYANMVAYILEVNGFKAGAAALPAGGAALEKMVIR